MGLLQSLGRLWNGSSHAGQARNGQPGQGGRSAAGVSPGAARRPVAIDLHTPTVVRPAGPDVGSIDRELSDRLGLKPSPLPSREVSREAAQPRQATVHGAMSTAAGTGRPARVVTGEVLEAVALADEPTAAASTAGHAGRGGGGLMSALLALPDRHEGRVKARSKQQVLDQLRENYEEVIRVVRKVDSTLDQQHRRGERMLEIAEHTVHGRLPELREETRKVGDAIDRLATGIGRGQDRLEQGVADQIVAIERVQSLLSQLVEADRSLGESLADFRQVAAGMAIATDRLGSTLGGMSDRAERRDAQMAAVLERSQKTLVTVMVLGLVSVASAIVMVVLAVV